MREYVSPKLEIIEFDVDDVICASPTSGGSGRSETENAYGSFSFFEDNVDWVLNGILDLFQ